MCRTSTESASGRAYVVGVYAKSLMVNVVIKKLWHTTARYNLYLFLTIPY